ncbi:hypothetical protein E2C01_098649 [Portunus trituberculatus]|uniref:Uncharacterized protein n=1 Tax=Portunus trituberculatus TaxID=210409 RepID=A0A5B7K8T0_PORTR|nr:hypothetical protein [Portunus trituberculatus]
MRAGVMYRREMGEVRGKGRREIEEWRFVGGRRVGQNCVIEVSRSTDTLTQTAMGGTPTDHIFCICGDSQ